MGKDDNQIKIAKAKGRPMLTWVGKRPLTSVRAYPAQHVESFSIPTAAGEIVPLVERSRKEGAWQDWPDQFPRGGLLFHGDNKDVLAHLLANGFRGKVKLIYIDPPFDSGADYVRKVELRGVRGATTIDGEEYTLGEQIQYTDIWANDNYLQFMYERLLMLKELLSEDGSLWLHCDWHKSHQLRCLLDEVFGSDNLQNEIVWQRTDPHNDAKSRLGWVHDTLYWYRKSRDQGVYNWQDVVEPISDAALREYSLMRLHDGTVVPYKEQLEGEGRRFKLDDCTWKGNDPSRRFEWRGARPSNKRVWPYDIDGMEKALKSGEFYLRDQNQGAARCRVSYLDEREGQVLQTIWTECGRMKGGVDYPTEKPRALMARIIQAASNAGDLILDCFCGSGATLVAAQALGRHWIGCDINKGAIQTTAKRLQTLMQEQAATLAKDKQAKLVEDENAAPLPAQLAFNTYRVNDYDLQIQHNEAVELACEHIGITRTRADGYFDGTLGNRLVKIVPLNHPLTPMDLEDLRQELHRRPEEERDITLVCLGMELAARAWIEDYNRARPINKLHVIELRTDRKYGGFMTHEPLGASVSVKRDKDTLRITVNDVFSPSILQRLNMEQGVFRAQIDDWRAVVDCILIDTDYDGEVFNVALTDIPARKQDLVEGRYELPAPRKGATVAVKIIDMLGEEVIVTEQV